MPHDTEVDRMLADPRRAAVMEDWTARMATGRPFRWHRLIDTTTAYEWHAGPDLALVVDMKWRLTRGGVETTLVSGWRTFSPLASPGSSDVPTP